MESYMEKTDEELIAALRNGEQEITDYLMEKYKNLVKKKAKALYLMGGDTDDLIQEGMIGLFKAVRDYRPDRDSSFYHFANICIARQMYTAVEAAQRKKHSPLNSYVPLYADFQHAGEQAIAYEKNRTEGNNPEEIMITQERLAAFRRKVSEVLSSMEQEVLSYYLQGFDYHQIAEVMGKEPKAIDKALQRLKKKLKENSLDIS